MEKINTLWHFGDSFGCWGNPENTELEAKIGFSKYIADNYNLIHKHKAVEGISNDEITNIILSYLSKFKKNDVIIINWSFLTRYSYLNKYNTPKNINTLLCKFHQKELDYTSNVNHDYYEFTSKEYLDFVLFEKSKFVLYESILQWKLFINKILLYIQDTIGCHIFNSFIDNVILDTNLVPVGNQSDHPFYQGQEADYVDILDKSLYNIKWSNDGGEYLHWLHQNDFYKDGEDVHYKFGVQKRLADAWIDIMDNQYFTSSKFNKKTI